MSTILFVTSSLSGGSSKSRMIAAELIDTLQADNPKAEIVTRDLHPDSMPHLTTGTLAGAMVPVDKRDGTQHEAAFLADRLIEEVEQADAIVLAVPMYNFGIPSTLKAWIDHIARAGRTFRYTAAGPEGLLKNKKVFAVMSRGGVYSSGPANVLDFQEPYLRAVLGFLGLTDVSFIHAEGLNISADAAAQGLEKARAAVAGLTPTQAVA